MKKVYYIGGSPCSGKSTVAERIAKEHNLYYYKVDDYLDEYCSKGKKAGKAICTKISDMTPEEIWMRQPEEQNEEEMEIYREIFEFILDGLNKLDAPDGIITEGAAYLPELMMKIGVDKKHYINITPTKDFQYLHYKERPFVPYILEGCKDKEKAFENWMERDVLFAQAVKRDALSMGYSALVTDGTATIDATYHLVCQMLGLED